MREKERQLEQERLARDQLSSRIRDMESKLLSGGKNIADRTNKQQRQLELSRQKISQQKVCGTCIWGRGSSFLLLWGMEGNKGCSGDIVIGLCVIGCHLLKPPLLNEAIAITFSLSSGSRTRDAAAD